MAWRLAMPSSCHDELRALVVRRACCYGGPPSKHGMRCDVLRCCSKAGWKPSRCGATSAHQHGGRRRPLTDGVASAAAAWAASAAAAVAAAPPAAAVGAAAAAATCAAEAAASTTACHDVQSSASPWTGSGFAGRRRGWRRAGRSRLEGDPAGRPE